MVQCSSVQCRAVQCRAMLFGEVQALLLFISILPVLESSLFDERPPCVGVLFVDEVLPVVGVLPVSGVASG